MASSNEHPDQTGDNSPDPFEGLTLDDNFVGGASIHELPASQRGRQGHGRGQADAPRGRGSLKRSATNHKAGRGGARPSSSALDAWLKEYRWLAIIIIAVILMTALAILVSP